MAGETRHYALRPFAQVREGRDAARLPAGGVVMGRNLSVRGVYVVLLALFGAACGDDDSGGHDAGHEDHVHDAGGFTGVPCGDVPQLAANTVAVGDEGHYRVQVIDTDPYSPPRKQSGDWVVEIQDSAGKLAADVDLLEVKPFMPAHGHNGIRKPVIDSGDEAGRFLVTDVNLWMGGPWEVTFVLDGPEGSDEALFDVCIED
jgi:hypothetical protein